MRVLVVPKWYPWPDRPVFGIFCQEQARALSSAHDVVVLASEAVRRPSFRLFEMSDAMEASLRTVRVRYRRPAFRPASMVCQIIGMLSAVRMLRRSGWRPQIVHAHVYSAGIPALILGRLNRAPVVISEHFTGFQRGLISGYDRLTARIGFRYAELVAPVSRDLADQIRAVQPRARIRVVPNVVDTDVFHPSTEGGSALDNAPVRLLTVAALAEKKGHVHLLDALAELRRRREVTLDLVGDGDQRDALERHVRDLGLDGAVRFHGERPKQEVAELMREADLFVLPSLFENLPCVLLEAMASGLPFVATAVGGVPELLDGPYGVLCPPGDGARLAEAIATALERRGGLDDERSVSRARARFGYEAFERTWTEIYRELRDVAASGR